MAQFVQIKYGKFGDRGGWGQNGQGYTYIIDDTQRTGNYVGNVPFMHKKAGKICYTHGTILSRRKSLERAIRQPSPNSKNPYSFGQDRDTINAELVSKFGSTIGTQNSTTLKYKMADNQTAQMPNGGDIKTIPNNTPIK